MDEVTATHRKVKTSLGHCWSVPRMDVLDTVPDLLASGLPVFLEIEFPILAGMSHPALTTFWQGRLKALASERALRAADATRTVYGSAERIVEDSVLAEETSWV